MVYTAALTYVARVGHVERGLSTKSPQVEEFKLASGFASRVEISIRSDRSGLSALLSRNSIANLRSVCLICCLAVIHVNDSDELMARDVLYLVTYPRLRGLS